jgi:ABC-type multidrug transport system permease subunit
MEMPAALRVPTRLNPVTYAVDLMRGALGQPMEFGVGASLAVLAVSTVVAFGAAAVLFDPERRMARVGGRR